MGVAGILLGLLAGWIIGSHHTVAPRGEPAPAERASAAPAQQQAPALDEALATRLKSTAESNPRDADTRVQLGDLYFDSGRFEEAAQWYQRRTGDRAA